MQHNHSEVVGSRRYGDTSPNAARRSRERAAKSKNTVRPIVGLSENDQKAKIAGLSTEAIVGPRLRDVD
jgi:hypothetical protein